MTRPITSEEYESWKKYVATTQYRPVAIIDDPDDVACDSAPGGRRLRDEHGVPLRREDGSGVGQEEVVPACPYEHWIDADGNLVQLLVGTNRDPVEFDENYAQFHRRNAKAHGWRPWKDFSSDEERLTWINERRVLSARRGKKYEELSKSPADVFADKTGRQVEQLVAQLARLVPPPPVTYEPVDDRTSSPRGFGDVAAEEVTAAARRRSRREEGGR